eukprot:scaffold54828_cov30-Tisochrysis_lutea.AAC.13
MEQTASAAHASCACVLGAVHFTFSLGARRGVADVKKESLPEPAAYSSRRERVQFAEPSIAQSSCKTSASRMCDRSGVSVLRPPALQSSGVQMASSDGETAKRVVDETGIPHSEAEPRTRIDVLPVVPNVVVNCNDELVIVAPRGAAKPRNWSVMREPAAMVIFAPLELTLPVVKSSRRSSPG